MTKPSVLLVLLLGGVAFAPPAFAQYKYVDPSGRVTYSDLPPPPTARVVEQKKLGASTAPTPTLPFEVQQAVSKYPVTIYTGEKCVPCDDGRNYLRNRGVPFEEKTVSSNDDIALFKQQSPDGTAPVLMVGSRKSIGFSQTAWSSLLDNAGYPQTSALPRDYQNPAPTSMSPNTRPPAENVTQAASQAQRAAAARGSASVPGSIPSSPPPAAPPTTAPGFKF
jgi:glutaredoxin